MNKLCGGKNIFSYTCVPRTKVLVEVVLNTSTQTLEVVSEGIRMSRKSYLRSKILTHFIKGKIFLLPMETILMIPNELEHLGNLMKLVRRKKDFELGDNQVFLVAAPIATQRFGLTKHIKAKLCTY